MKKHPLRQISRRTQRLLLLLLIVVGGLALYDLANLLGPRWYALWLAWPIPFLLWLHYAFRFIL